MGYHQNSLYRTSARVYNKHRTRARAQGNKDGNNRRRVSFPTAINPVILGFIFSGRSGRLTSNRTTILFA